jgi:hypothetical protein
MNKVLLANLIFLIGAVLALLGCAKPVTSFFSPKPNQYMVHEGKSLVLVREATKAEWEIARRRLTVLPGDTVWYYETAIHEIMAGEKGFCVVRNGIVLSRYFIWAQ